MLRDCATILSISRVLVAWQPIGIAMGAYDVCLRYVKQREQFGTPLAAFQLVQEKLARMLGNIQVRVSANNRPALSQLLLKYAHEYANTCNHRLTGATVLDRHITRRSRAKSGICHLFHFFDALVAIS